MAQEPNTELPEGVIPATSDVVYERMPIPTLDPDIQSELLDSLIQQQSDVRRQAGVAEGAERQKSKTIESTSARTVEAIKTGEQANELERLGKLEKAKREDAVIEDIAKTNGTEVLNAILGNEVLDAARDVQEAARNYDNFMETRGDETSLFGAFFDKSKHNALARKFNRAEERFLSLQQQLNAAAQTASAQARAARELQPTAPLAKEQEAERLRNVAKSSLAQAQETERAITLKAESESRILEFKKAGVAGIANFFDTYSRLVSATAQGIDAEMREKQLLQMDATLSEMVMRPEQTSFILARTPLTADKLASMNAQQRVTALKIANGVPLVLNLADQKEVQDAAGVVDTAHPNPYIKYIFKQIAPTINQDASMINQTGAVFDALPEDKKTAARKEGARKQKEFETFFDTRPVEFIDATGRKETKTTSQWIGDRIFQDPAGSGIIAFTNKYADDYVKSGRPGAKLIETIRNNIAGESLKSGQLIDAEYWRAASGNNAEAMYDAYKFMQEQIVANTPWREFGLKSPQGSFDISYGARSASWLPYKQKSVRIQTVEDVTRMFIQMDNVKKAEGYYKNSQQVGAPLSPFPSKEEMKSNFKSGVTEFGDMLFGDEQPQKEKE